MCIYISVCESWIQIQICIDEHMISTMLSLQVRYSYARDRAVGFSEFWRPLKWSEAEWERRCLACSIGYRSGVSINGGTTKQRVYEGKSYLNGWFGGTPIQETSKWLLMFPMRNPLVLARKSRHTSCLQLVLHRYTAINLYYDKRCLFQQVGPTWANTYIPMFELVKRPFFSVYPVTRW